MNNPADKLPWQVRNAPRPGSSPGDVVRYLGEWATRSAPTFVRRLERATGRSFKR